jgi:hypothetical protein
MRNEAARINNSVRVGRKMRNMKNARQEKDTPGFILEFQENRLLYSGALGVSIVALTSLMQFSPANMETALTASLWCLVVSIPTNAMGVYLTTFAIQRGMNLRLRPAFVWISIVGLIATLGSVTGLFWHFDKYVGVSFFLVSVASTVFALTARALTARALSTLRRPP